MTIDITLPELQALLEERLQTGAFRNAEEVILHALRASDAEYDSTGADLIRVMQEAGGDDFEMESPHERMPVRDLSF